MSRNYRIHFLLALAIAVTAGAVWIASSAQRAAGDASVAELATANGILTAMLDQETGLRGFVLTGREEFLEPYVRGHAALTKALARAERISVESDERALLRRQAAAATAWQRAARVAIARTRARGRAHYSVAELAKRKVVFDRFRRINVAFRDNLEGERKSRVRKAGLLSAAVIGLLAAVFGVLGIALVRRQRRGQGRRLERERRDRESQAEFAESMQLMRDEGEANDLVRRHLERVIPNVKVLVLNRNNSDNRLEAVSGEQDPDVAASVDGASPESCLAIRLGREHRDGLETDPLLQCEVCGKRAGSSLCFPSLVGGEVIGSVLVSRDEHLADAEAERVEQCVSRAAPVLANLRNLAIAETRAATDGLTGLPNKRSAADTLKRMAAQASRTVTPLAALLLDLDYFKQINDRFGHGAGDNVLASVGDVLLHGVRTSDFVGRNGGEEFIALLPDTGRAGAEKLAETLRERISAIRVPEVDRAITTSVGVAVLPDHAADPESLLRMADRALYAAKAAGRDRVMVADARPADHPPAEATA